MNGSSFIASAENAVHLAIPRNPVEVVSSLPAIDCKALNPTLMQDFNPDESFHPVGGQFSSLSDLANATRFLLNPPRSSKGSLIRLSALRDWIRPSSPQPDTATESGLVWEILKLADSHGRIQRFYGKAGSLATFHSELIFNKKLQFGLVMLSTGYMSTGPLVREVLPLLLPGFESILEERTRERYAGVWKGDVNADDEIVVVVEGGMLSITNWRVNGHDFLRFYLGGLLDRVSLWSTGKLDEFRQAYSLFSLDRIH